MTNRPSPLDVATFASLVDHTLLKATATAEQVDRLCAEAAELSTASVCVNGAWVSRVHRRLEETGVLTCSVVGFPLGAMEPAAIAAETSQAVDDGADEIDMVVPIGPLVSGDDGVVASQVERVRHAAGGSTTVKVILETAVLDDAAIVRGCRLAVGAGADFVKTSTGFDPAGGATVEAVALMRDTVGADIGVKASGGIRTLADVEAMIAAGADRLGMSATAAVVEELRSHS